MATIFCSATVDIVRPSSPKGLGQFRVTVTGREPNDYVKIYNVQARNDNQAAQIGIERFQEEISLQLGLED